MRKYKWSFYLTFVFYTARIFFAYILSVIYFKKIIDIISNSDIPKEALIYPLMHLVIINIIIFFLGQIFARTTSWSLVYFQSNVMRELSNFSFGKIVNNSYGFFTNNFVGSLVTKSRRFIRAFVSMHDILLFNFWGTFVVLVGVFFVLFKEATFVALIFLAFIFVYLAIVLLFVKTRMRYDIAKAAADSRVGGRLADVFSNIFALKIFSAVKQEKSSFHEITLNEEMHRNKAWYFGIKQELLQGILMFIVQSFILYLTVKLWLANEMTTGMVVLVQTYMVMIFERLWELGKTITKFMESAVDMKEIIDIFEAPVDILDPENPAIISAKKGEIEFKNVSFVYDSGQKVFKNFNLKVKSGEKIGLVGHSGAGKSTITKLLLRFVDVSSGEIMIDGQDIRSVLQDDLREIMSFIPQEPILFHRPIQENIAYGKPKATKEEIISVAKKAHADEFIADFKFGYETLVGERGVKLSGGERQRVAIARAMLKSAPILILDEATSSLDSISESYIQDAFSELMKGKTTIVIAHRLSTIQKMDRIVVLDKGKIVEQGTHKELLAKNGVYSNLWEHQTGGFLE